MSDTVCNIPYHIPALLEESIRGLDIKHDIGHGGTYVDATFGGGGHSRAILRELSDGGRLYGFDRDMDAYANRPDDARFTFVNGDFRYLANFLEYYGVDGVDGILADLGVSFHHFDDAERGFSFRADAPLDMRMNRRGDRTAASILADAPREEIERMMRAYADLKRPGAVAAAIAAARDKTPLLTTTQLWEAVRPALNPKGEKKELAQVFQALRIEVNAEMEALERLLRSALEVLKPGGRLAVITYHSVEDRMVKNFMRSGHIDGHVDQDVYGRIQTPWKLITRSPITPSETEVEANPRSRSAKLRIAEKTADTTQDNNTQDSNTRNA